MNVIRKWWNNHQKKDEIQKQNMLRGEFEIVEKSGIVWIMHNGVAFDRIDADSTASEIAERLNNARQTALEYRSL